MAELTRLIAAGRFASYRELSTQLGVQQNTITEIGKGRYHCNLKLLYQVAALYSETDVLWVVHREAATGRPEPTELLTRQPGHPASVH